MPAALNVTNDPEQKAPGGVALIERLTDKLGLTDSRISFEVAGLPVGQIALEIRLQAITSLFTGIYE
jgi:hypothetical protein